MKKSELRIKYKAERLKLSQDSVKMDSKKIFSVIEGLNLTGIGSVFLSIEKFNEVNTSFIIDGLQQCTFAVSKMSGVELRHYELTDDTIIEINNWGIPEPQNGIEVVPHKFDFVIVPLLVADKFGSRVGYGKGIYDRFLALCSKECQFIGVSLFEPIVGKIETNEFDIPLDYLATPTKLYEFN